VTERDLRVVVIGAGMAGILSAIKLHEAGIADVTIYEKADRLGGTWRENRYPGIACDVPSHLYRYSFAPNPDWSHVFSPGAEIQAYLEDVARRHGVDERIQRVGLPPVVPRRGLVAPAQRSPRTGHRAEQLRPAVPVPGDERVVGRPPTLAPRHGRNHDRAAGCLPWLPASSGPGDARSSVRSQTRSGPRTPDMAPELVGRQGWFLMAYRRVRSVPG
jgi:phytoene dehydrogenase-like protein